MDFYRLIIPVIDRWALADIQHTFIAFSGNIDEYRIDTNLGQDFIRFVYCNISRRETDSPSYFIPVDYSSL